MKVVIGVTTSIRGSETFAVAGLFRKTVLQLEIAEQFPTVWSNILVGNSSEEVKMAKFLFVLSSGTENSNKPTRCMQFAQIAKEQGHEVNIFLTDDGVVFGKKGMAQNVASINGDEMMTYLEFLQDEKVPFYV